MRTTHPNCRCVIVPVKERAVAPSKRWNAIIRTVIAPDCNASHIWNEPIPKPLGNDEWRDLNVHPTAEMAEQAALEDFARCRKQIEDKLSCGMLLEYPEFVRAEPT